MSPFYGAVASFAMSNEPSASGLLVASVRRSYVGHVLRSSASAMCARPPWIGSSAKETIVDHRSVAIIPSSNLDSSEAFYKQLGFDVVSDYGHYRILADGRGWHLHLTHAPGWPRNIEDNPFGLYLYVDDVDAVVERVRDLIIENGAPHIKPWGTYEFALSDPSGLLVRVGRIIDVGS